MCNRGNPGVGALEKADHIDQFQGAPRSRRACSGGPGLAVGLREGEAELRHRLVAVQLVGRVPRTRDGRGLGRHAQMGKDASYGLSLAVHVLMQLAV